MQKELFSIYLTNKRSNKKTSIIESEPNGQFKDKTFDLHARYFLIFYTQIFNITFIIMNDFSMVTQMF